MTRVRFWMTVGGIGAVVVAAAALTLAPRSGLVEEGPPPARDAERARPVHSSSWRNLGADVSYVGDEACGGCHAREARTYPLTAMGRSFALPSQVFANDPALPASGVTFDNPDSGRRYRIAMEGGVLTHTEIRLDESGKEALSDRREISHVLGSGDRGQTFLVRQGGRLYQSAIALRRTRDGWGMAAGLEGRESYPFMRPVLGPCLFCHSNRALYVERTLNEYRELYFEGLAIGCERCHGPGSLHVQERRAIPPGDSGLDTSIVNPRKLPAALRDDVCFQCHLQGNVRIQKAGHGLHDFRPGRPLSEFAAIYHLAAPGQPGEAKEFEVVSHVERLRSSRCFKASGGGIFCLSCHDPHRTPRGEEAVRQFRQACLTCHAEEDCSGHGGNAMDCTGCHMGKMPPSDAPHTLFTDHRIARRPKPAQDHPSGDAPGAPAQLVSFFEPGASAERDLGVAHLVYSIKEGDAADGARGAALLEPLVPALGSDFNALLQLASHYKNTGRISDLPPILERLIAIAPGMAEIKVDLGRRWAREGRAKEALALLLEAVREDPYYAPARFTLGEILLQAGDVARAEAEHREAARLDPSMAAAHLRLGDYALRRGAREEAITSYRAALALAPDLGQAREGLRRAMAGTGPG